MCPTGIEDFFNPIQNKRLKILNFFTYGLIGFGLILRFFVSDSGDNGIGRTPMFLFIIQFVLTILLILMLICGEIHKPIAVLVCFPLLMSRVGRGAIILMVSLPITNFLDFWTVLIAIFCALVGILNMSLGWKDGVVELKFAEEGIPERGMRNVPTNSNPAPPPPQNQMPPMATGAPGPAMPPPQMNYPAAPPQQPPMAGPPAGTGAGGKRDVMMNDPFMQDVEL